MKLRKPFLLSIGLLVVAIVLTGCLGLSRGGDKSADVTGKVAYVDGTVVPDATVRLGTETTTTNPQGVFAFKDVPNGTYALTVTIGDEDVHTRQVTVAGKPLNLDIQLPLAECWGGPDAPAGMSLVLCLDGREADTVEGLGFDLHGGNWSIVEADGRHWIEVLGSGINWASIDVPQLAAANKIVVEFTGMYTSEANTWGILFLDYDASKAHQDAYMVLSAWNGVHFRPYKNATFNANHSWISTPKVEQGETVTLRIVYDRTTHNVDMYRNGVRQSLANTNGAAMPQPIPAEYHYDAPEQTLLKLYVNGTNARFTDIRVWVDGDL